MARVTKAELEDIIEEQKRTILRTIQDVAMQTNEIRLLRELLKGHTALTEALKVSTDAVAHVLTDARIIKSRR